MCLKDFLWQKRGDSSLHLYTSTLLRRHLSTAHWRKGWRKGKKKKNLLSRHWRRLKQLTGFTPDVQGLFLNISYFPVWARTLENDMKHEIYNITPVYLRYEGGMLSESSQNRSAVNMLGVPAHCASCGIDWICVHLEAHCSTDAGPQLAGRLIVWWQKIREMKKDLYLIRTQGSWGRARQSRGELNANC